MTDGIFKQKVKRTLLTYDARAKLKGTLSVGLQ
jgi:hypothetical protein